MSGDREQIAADTISRLRDFEQRLETGGDVAETGLPVTTCGECADCYGAGWLRWMCLCPACHGTGVVRVRMEDK